MKKLILFFALTTIIALSAFQCDPDDLTYFNIENATLAEITVTIERIGKIIIPPGETKLIHTESGLRATPPSTAYTYLYDPAVTINGRLVSDAFWRNEYWTEEGGKHGNGYYTYTLTLTDQLIETLLLPEN